MKQYEERFKRLNEHMESDNQGYLKAQEELKKVKLNQETAQVSRDQFLTHLLEKSNALKSKIIKLCNTDPKGKSLNLKQTLQDVEQGQAQILSLKTETDYVAIEMRDHVLDIY